MAAEEISLLRLAHNLWWVTYRRRLILADQVVYGAAAKQRQSDGQSPFVCGTASLCVALAELYRPGARLFSPAPPLLSAPPSPGKKVLSGNPRGVGQAEKTVNSSGTTDAGGGLEFL